MNTYFFVETVPQAAYSIQFFTDENTPIFITTSKNVKKFLDWYGIEKKNIFSSLGNVENSTICFFCKCWKLKMFKRIQKLSKNNSVYYYQREPYKSIPSSSFKRHFLKFFVSFFYGLDVVITKEAEIDVVQLSDNFFTKNNIKTTYQPFDKNNERIKTKLKPIVGKNRVLVLLSDLSGYSWISDKRFSEFNKMIRSVLKEKDYLVKFHPNDKRTVFGYPEERTIPNYIPAEYLFNFNWDLVIGIESYSLVLAHTSPVVVSCLNMLDFPVEVTDDCHRFLENECKHIRFPSNKPDFEIIVKEALK